MRAFNRLQASLHRPDPGLLRLRRARFRGKPGTGAAAEGAAAGRSDIRWNFIGHLQRNKVRAVLPYLHRVCSLDSLELAAVLDKEAARLSRTIGVLSEFNLAQETTKTGLAAAQADAFFEALSQFEHLIPEGIMVMGPHVEDEAAIAAVFRQARALFDRLKKNVRRPAVYDLFDGDESRLPDRPARRLHAAAPGDDSVRRLSLRTSPGLRFSFLVGTTAADQSKNAQPQYT